MFLDIFNNYEHIHFNSKLTDLSNYNILGSILVELLNNYSNIRNLLEKEKNLISQKKDSNKLESFSKIQNLTPNLEFIYSIILNEYNDSIMEFDNSKKELQPKLNSEQKYNEKIECIDNLIEKLDFIYELCNVFYESEISLFHLNRLLIPRALLLYVIQQDDKIFDIYTIKHLNISLKNSNIEKIKTNNISLVYSYDIICLNELVSLYAKLIIEKKITVKKCKNCNRYFITESRTDEIYCNNISPQNPNKTCKEYGAKKTYRDNIKSRPLKDEHYKTSQFFRMRIQRNKGKNNIQEVEKLEKLFNKYKTNYEKKLKQYNNKKLSEEDFINWIIEQKHI